MEPCDRCTDPSWCTGTYPQDDPHRPGEIRGCFAEKTGSVLIMDAAPGRTMKHGIARRSQPSWEAGRPGEYRPDGSFMPYIDPRTGENMTQKRYVESGRRDIEIGRQKRLAGHTPKRAKPALRKERGAPDQR